MLSIFKNTIDFVSKNSFVLFIFFVLGFFFLLASGNSLGRWFIRSFRWLSLWLFFLISMLVSQIHSIYYYNYSNSCEFLLVFFLVSKEKVVHIRAHTNTRQGRERESFFNVYKHAHCSLLPLIFIYGAAAIRN